MDYFEKRFEDMRNTRIMMMLTAILFLVSCDKDYPISITTKQQGINTENSLTIEIEYKMH
jgi:hypothetical protein